MSMTKFQQDAEGMTLAVACGGTGGHFFPGLAIAREFKRKGGTAILFVGGSQQDAQIKQAEEEALEAVPSPVVRLPRSKLGLPLFAVRLAWCVLQTARLLGKHGVDLGIVMGSYASAPLGLALLLRGKPLAVHEGNAILGRANRRLAKYAAHTMLSLPIPELLCEDDTTLVGMPVRTEILGAADHELEDEESLSRYEALGLSPGFPVVLVFGGSQGAEAINQAVLGAIPRLDFPPLQLVHFTGKEDNREEQELCEKHEIMAQIAARTDQMGAYLAVADLVVSRAGGSTVAELAVTGRPSILIPYPHATDAHQALNAEVVARAKGGHVIAEADLTSDALREAITAALTDPELRRSQREGILTLAHPRAAEDIVSLLIYEQRKTSN